MLVAHGLTRRYGARAAVSDVSFSLTPGELVAIIGPNGAGKTTLLSMLAGVLAPTAGRLEPPGGRSVGWVPQQPALYTKLSVAENLRLFARLERRADPEAAVQQMLALTGLAERAGDSVALLSGGNQQRLNIAIGLLGEPAVLLLDEPSSSLDPLQRERLFGFVRELAAGGTAVLYSTHNVFEAERYADRVLVLAGGELLFDGAPAELSGAGTPDYEAAFVAFLRERGHS